MHVLPQLRKLEEKHRDVLVVLGIHSAKFDSEKATANISQAVSRYNVQHPVVNDANFAIWKHFGVKAWPTLMFIDPEGKVIGRHEGEFSFNDLDKVIQRMLGEYAADGMLNRDLLPFQHRAIAEQKRSLSYPGKIEVDPAAGRLFIADSNHHRVLVTSLEGKVEHVIGNGEVDDITFAEQGFGEGVFDNPQGMAVDGNTVYVGDVGSHTIKKIDLASKTVRIVAGNGQQSLYRHSGGDALANPLNSPYDLGLRKGILYIAMAGFHQLWSMDIEAGTIEPFAGTGAEAITDGLRNDSMLAQPYGLAVKNSNVFFADSETSALRLAKIGDGGRVVTLVGTGLFDFGDAEGIGKEAMLQHVQGVAVGQDVVFMADTYNHRIKRMSLATLRVLNVAGSGRAGSADGPAKDSAFNEPAGVAVAGNTAWVADTNNHVIRVIDLVANRVTTLELNGL